MDHQGQSSETAASGSPSEASTPNLLWGIVVRPVSTLVHIRNEPRGNWLAPVILAILLVIAQNLISIPVANQAAAQQVERQLAQIPPEEQARAQGVRSQVGRGSSLPLMTATALVTGLMSLLVRWLFRSGAIHLVSLALGGRNRFNQVFSMVAWTWVPLMIRSLLQTLTIALSNTVPTHHGLTAYLAALGRPIPTGLHYSLLSQAQLDLFVLWNLSLLSLGVLITTDLSKVKAMIVTSGYWVLASALSLLPPVLGQALASRFLG